MVGKDRPNRAHRTVVGQRMKRPLLLLVIIFVAITALFVSLWVGEGPLWRMVMLKEPWSIFTVNEGPEYFQTEGYVPVTRWPMTRWPIERRIRYVHGSFVTWHPSTGFKAVQAVCDYGSSVRQTIWYPDGRVLMQSRGHKGDADYEEMKSPPWWWGVQDQTEPTSPRWGKE